MKKFLLIATAIVALAIPSTSQAGLVAGWETWSASGTHAASQTGTGFTGSAVSTDTSGLGWGLDLAGKPASTDTTFGGLTSETANASTLTNAGIRLPNTSEGFIDFTVTETNGTAIDLSAFHFDATRFRPNGAGNYSLEVLAGSSITVGAVAGGTGQAPNVGGTLGTQDWADFDIDLTGLGDSQLDANGTAIFRLTFTSLNTNGAGGHDLFLDNVAISSIPEPTSLTLFAVGSLGMLFRRRK